MGGGLMQLVAYGAQDIYLTGNPQITFFKVVYRRHTNFSMEAIQQTFNGSAGFGNKGDFSQREIRCAAFIRLQQNRISCRWITFYGVKNSNSRDNLRCKLSGEIFFHYEKIMAEG